MKEKLSDYLKSKGYKGVNDFCSRVERNRHTLRAWWISGKRENIDALIEKDNKNATSRK